MIWRLKLAFLAIAMVLPSVGHDGGGHQPHTHEEVEISLPAKRRR
jgi:hypothetical protein